MPASAALAASTLALLAVGGAADPWRLTEPIHPTGSVPAAPAPSTTAPSASAPLCVAPLGGSVGTPVDARCTLCTVGAAALPENATAPAGSCFLPHCGCWPRDCGHGALHSGTLRCECEPQWDRSPATGRCTVPRDTAGVAAVIATSNLAAAATADAEADGAGVGEDGPVEPATDQDRFYDSVLRCGLFANLAAWGVAIQYAKRRIGR